MNKQPVNFSHSDARGEAIDQTLESLFRNQGNRMFDYGVVQTYPEKSVIFHQDTQAHAVYLIEKGLVKLVRLLENGKSIIVGIRRRHWLIGGPAVILDRVYFVTAITLLPSTLRCIGAKDFLDLVKSDNDFSWYFHLILAQEFLRQMKNAEARNCIPAKQRMKHFLRDIIDDQNLNGTGSYGFSVPLTNIELSQLLAITPEHLCRIMKELKQEGLIRSDKGVLTVTDPASL